MSLKKQASLGMFWTFSQQFGQQIVLFIVSTILARLLMPKEFGLIGMISVFYGVGGALLNGGLTQSLVRSKELDQEDYSTVFYYNLFASIILYIIIFVLAPLIAQFYGYPILTDIIRLYCLSFIIFAFSMVQETKLTKEMNFKTQAFVSLPSVIIGGATGITLAYLGYGVWSIVWNQLVTASLRSLQFWIYSKWTPSLMFSVSKFKEHLNFGYKITLSSILERVFNNLYIILIGRYFSASQVGYYTRADTMKNLPVTNLTMAMSKVTYPLFAEIQHDDERLKRVYQKLMKMVVFVVTPTLIFLAILAKPVFRFLFTEKWLFSVPYFQILCFAGILYPLQAYNINVLNVKGRSDLSLRLVIVNKSLLVIGAVIGFQFGIYGLLYSQVILTAVSFFIYAHYTDKFINYSALEQFKDILPNFILVLVPSLLVFYTDYLIEGYTDILRLIFGGLVGGLTYIGLAYLFKFSSLNELQSLILNRVSSKNN